MPIKPRRPILPSYNVEKPFANVCKTFGRLDKVEIAYRHRIQAESNDALAGYIQRMTEHSTLFESCWRRNNNRVTATDRFMGYEGDGTDAEYVRLPYQFKLRDNDMISGWRDIKLTGNRLYPDGVRDMEMHFSINFQRLWQNNASALSYPVHIRNARREVVTPDNFNLSDLFTLHPDNFPHTVDMFNLDTNVLDGHRWHDTFDVPGLFSKQLLFLRDYIEAQFPLAGNVTHAQLQRRAIQHEIAPRKFIRILPDDLLARAGGVAPLFNWQDFYIPHLELAFDYQCADAMQIVQDLMMRALGVSFSATAGFRDISLNRESNIPTVNINLTKNVTIAIYAKALERLRLEVRYKGSIHSILRRGIDAGENIPDIIEKVMTDAQKRTVKLLKALPAPPAEPISRALRMTEFIRHVSHAFDHDHNRIRHFLNSLSIIGSFSHLTSGDATPYNYLVDHNILQASLPGLRNTSVQYSATEEYVWIIETLRARYFES